ncbi:MAG: hypothetical protein KAS23_04540 [Anaerohalosphaera sp.]|nr:hypothetical protein [Anaerohalosphaera sp.]
MRELKKAIVLFVAIVLLVSVFFGTRYLNSNPYEKRIEWTQISLIAVRYDISLFYEKYGRYPDSFSEIKQVSINIDDTEKGFSERQYKEYISCEEGETAEVNKLDNSGGWFYNPENGEVKINLTESLHTYFPNYYYFNRNQIPSEWQPKR